MNVAFRVEIHSKGRRTIRDESETKPSHTIRITTKLAEASWGEVWRATNTKPGRVAATHSCVETGMPGTNESVVERFAAQAIAGGAKTLKIEYDEGYEDVCAFQGDAGVSIGHRIPSSSQEAKSLRAELYAMRKRPRRIEVGGRTYELRCRTYDSFGEDAFEVKFRRV